MVKAMIVPSISMVKGRPDMEDVGLNESQLPNGRRGAGGFPIWRPANLNGCKHRTPCIVDSDVF